MGERERSKQFGEEPVWENRGKRGQKGLLGCLAMPCACCDCCGVSCLLIKLSLAVFLVRVSAGCARVSMDVGVPVMAEASWGPAASVLGWQQPERWW